MAVINMKICSNCKLSFSVQEFTPRKDRPIGQFYSRCKKCSALKSLEWYHRNLDTVRPKLRARAKLRPIDKEQRNKTSVIHKERHPEQGQANRAVRSALRNGSLGKWPCVVCGDPKTHGHHGSYAPDMWLAVQWLCKKHHGEVHHKSMRGE